VSSRRPKNRGPRRAGRPRRERRERTRDVFVPRPFDGLAGEAEWVALREIVPAATAPLTMTDERFAERPVTLATVLPMAWPGMVKEDGRIFLGLQTQFRSGDLSRDLAAVLERALDTDPGAPVTLIDLPGPGARLQDLVDAETPVEPTLHEGFDFWLDNESPDDPNVSASLERANAAIAPTVRLSAAPAAYWCRMGDRTQIRWVLPHDEDATLNAFAKLYATGGSGGGLSLGEGTRYLGTFRAHGLLAPVWDLPEGTPAADCEEPVKALSARLDDALADDKPLTAEQRHARDGLRGRQVTLR
jgi:Family of unknown function (DUF5926)